MYKISKRVSLLIKILGGIIIFTIVLFLLLKTIIAIPAVQNKLKEYSTNALEEQLNSNVSIGSFHLGFPKNLIANDIFITNSESDTLLFLGELSINVRILPLLRHKITLRKIELTVGKGDFGRLLSQLTDYEETDHQEVDPESTAWELVIDKLHAESCYFVYSTNIENGLILILDIGKLKIELGVLDFDSVIAIQTFEASNTFVDLIFPTYLAVQTDVDTTSAEFADIRIAKTRLENARFSYADSTEAYLFTVTGEKVNANDLLVGINNNIVAINKGYALNTNTQFIYLPIDTANVILDESADTADNSWRIQGNELELDHFGYCKDYIGQPDPPGHFNPGHILFNEITGKLSDFVVHGDTLRAGIKNLSGHEKNGFKLLKLNAIISQEDSVFSIRNFKMNTTNAEYSVNLISNINSSDFLDVKGKWLNLDINIISENWKDIDYFYPFLDSAAFLVNGFRNNGFEINTSIQGSTDRLDLEQLHVHYLNETDLIVDGSIRDLDDPESLKVDLNIQKIGTTKSDLEHTFAGISADSTFSLPEHILLQGNYNLAGATHSLAGIIQSDVGTIRIEKATAILESLPAYSLSVTTDLKNLKSLSTNGLDQIAMKANAEFSGNDIYTSKGLLNLIVDSLTYNQYTYHNAIIDAEITNGNLEAGIHSFDTNLLFGFTAQGMLSETDKIIHTNIDLKNIDLHSLNLFNENFKLTGISDFTFSLADEHDMSLDATIQSLDFYFSDTVYNMHPISIQFVSNNFQTGFNLESYYYNLTASIDDYIENIPGALKELPSCYLTDKNHDSIEFVIPEFRISGELDYPEAFARIFFPNLPAFKNLTIQSEYNKSNDALSFDLSIPGFLYKSLFTDSLFFSVTGTSKALNYKGMATIEIDDMLKGNLGISGDIKNSKLFTNLAYFDSFSNQYLNLSTRLHSSDSNFIVQILPDELIFSYDKWNINPNNQVIAGPSYISFKNFNLESKSQKISINSYPEGNSKNVRLQLHDFALGSLEQLFADDTLVAGFADADFIFYDLFNNPSVEGDLTIEEMNLYDVEIGKFTMPNFAYNKNQMLFDLALKGEHDDIALKGSWIKNSSQPGLYADLKINRLDFEQLNYLLSDYITKSEGKIIGELKIEGDMQQPLVNGQINFSKAGVGLKALNNYFTLGSESIVVKNNTLHFDQFTIVNQQNQSAKIFGTISPDPSGKAYQDLRIISDDMVIMNSTQQESDILFGLLQTQINLELQGFPEDLKMNAEVDVDNSTNLTYIFPDALKLNDSKGVVLYNKYQPDSIDHREQTEKSSLFSAQHINTVNAEINLNPGIRLKLFFDEEGTDYLDASLEGLTNFNSYQGVTDISGTITIANGKLHYAVPMVSVNEYNIEPGSYITLSNDLYNPYIILNASAEVRASTEGLISDYDKVMDFKILLRMTGELSKLKLKFDISSETDDPVVSARLAQLTEQERNINALNLLVRGTFTFNLHGNEAGSASSADAQIDKFYTTHLNHLISENIHFVDLHFDVQSFRDYNSSGDIVFKRNYYYNVGKSLYKDRARINYKGSLGVTNDLEAEQVNSHFIENELELEVKFTDDGAYRGVFFRKNKYEGLLEGEVIETGGGIRIKRDYYSVKDIFIKEEEEEVENNRKSKKPGKNTQ